MATKRRPRRPLRSELSDGIKKVRKNKPVKTVTPYFVDVYQNNSSLEKDEPVFEEVFEEVELEDSNEVLEVESEIENIEDEIQDELEEEAEETKEELTEEDLLRARAKELGVSNWWNKKVETLQAEIKELESEDGDLL